MALVLYSVLRRHLKGTRRYFEPKDGRDCPLAKHIPSGEDLVGWYENPEPWEASFILFTDKAIIGFDGKDEVRIELSDVMGYETPEKSLAVTGIRVRTRDGFRFLRIAGTHGPHGRNAEQLERIGAGDRLFSNAWGLVQVLHVLAGINANVPRRSKAWRGP